MQKFNKNSKKGFDYFKSVDFLSILIAYIIVIIVFSNLSPHFLTIRNFLNIGQYAAVIGVVATSMTLIIVSGNIDISLGSMVALCGMVLAIIIPDDQTNFIGFLIAILACIVAGTLCGTINGFFITKVGVNAFITTMATMNIFRGVAYLITGGTSRVITSSYLSFIGRERTLGIPHTLVILLIAVLVFWSISKYTVFGRRLYIIGGNKQAAHLSGIKVERNIMTMFAINGVMVGIAAVMTTSQLGAALPQGSVGMEFQIISAVILGGTSFTGGRGSQIGTVFGVFLLATLNNGMIMAEITTFWQLVVLGVVLILAVSIDVIKTKRFSVT